MLTRELGGPIEEVFSELDPAPLAAASIAEVHAGRLRTGEDVVVKVQRPAIGPIVERDLDIVGRLARRLEFSTSWASGIGGRELAAGFADAYREELDFRIEAANMVSVARGMAAGRCSARSPAP